MDDAPGLASALADEIDRRGISQAAAAVILDTTQQTLSKWLNGIHVPARDRLPTIAEFLNRSPEEVDAMLPPLNRSRRRSNAPRLSALEDRLERIALRQANLGERIERLADRLEQLESR